MLHDFLIKLFNNDSKVTDEEINDLTAQIDALKDLIDTVRESVYFNITTFWAVLGFVVTTLGISLFFLVRTWVNSRIEKELKKHNFAEIHKLLDDRINSIQKELKKINIHEYAKKDQTNWISPTLLNGWVSNGSVGYLKDELGFIHIKGITENGLLQDGTVLFYLPQSYRPIDRLEFVVACEDDAHNYLSPAKVIIEPDGKVAIHKCPYRRVILNSIRYLA